MSRGPRYSIYYDEKADKLEFTSVDGETLVLGSDFTHPAGPLLVIAALRFDPRIAIALSSSIRELAEALLRAY